MSASNINSSTFIQDAKDFTVIQVAVKNALFFAYSDDEPTRDSIITMVALAYKSETPVENMVKIFRGLHPENPAGADVAVKVVMDFMAK